MPALPQQPINPRQRIFITAAASTMILVLSGIIWHLLYHQHLAHDSYRGDIFRPAMLDAWAPFYIWRMPWQTGNWLLVAWVVLVIVFLFTRYRQVFHKKYFLFGVLVFWLLSALFFAWSDSLVRLVGNYAHFKSFANDTVFFEGISDMLKNYTAKQAQLDTHGQHYPPGYLFMIMGGGMTFFRVLNYLFALLALFITYHVAKKQTDLGTAKIATCLLACTPGFLIFPTLDPSGMVTCFSIAGMYCVLQLFQAPNWRFAALLGAILFLFAFCSFVVMMWALFAGIWLLLSWKQINFTALLSNGAITLFTLGLLYGLLYLFTGFNQWTCFTQSTHLARTLNTVTDFDSPIRYLLRSFDALLGIVVSFLPVLVFSGFWANRWGKAFFLMVLISAFSGTFFGEMERIFTFLSPFVAIATALYLRKNEIKEQYVLAWALLFSAAFELFFHHFA